jgi:hypothetical protein
MLRVFENIGKYIVHFCGLNIHPTHIGSTHKINFFCFAKKFFLTFCTRRLHLKDLLVIKKSKFTN